MAQILRLPPSDTKENRENLSTAIETMIRPALEVRNRQQIMWWITDAYLAGARQFAIIDPREGRLGVSWEEEDGSIGMRHEEVLTKIETEVGRLSRLDLSARVKKRENTLESLRNASLAQVLLDQHESSMPDAAGLNNSYIGGLVRYGTYGIAAWEDEESDSPLTHVRELIPPWELLGIPAGYANPGDLRIIVRTHLFPVIELIKAADGKLDKGGRLPDDEGELELVDLPHGASIRNTTGPGAKMGGMPSFETFPSAPGSRNTNLDKVRQRELETPDKSKEVFVRLRECFVLTPRGLIARHIVRAGRAIFRDKDFLKDGIEMPNPIGIGRYHDTGQFYGRSFAEKIIPMALEIEELMQRTIVDTANINRLWFLLVPDTLGLTDEDFVASDFPKVAFYSPDLSRPDLKIENLVPPNLSTLAKDTLQFLTGMQDRVVAQGPIFEGEAPGRAESGKFVNILAQTGSTHLVPPAVRAESAYATMYRHLLWITKRRLIAGGSPAKGLPLTKIDNSIAGISIDAATGRLKLDPSGLPEPMEVDIGIQSADPTEFERRRAEGLQAFQAGVLTPLEFVIFNYKEGWNYPIGQKAVWENYVKAVLWNLILFNDGQTPGQLPGTERDPQTGQIVMPFFNHFFDKPEVHLKAIEDFVSGPEFSLSSVPVQMAFTQRIDLIRASMGEQLPPQFQAVDEAALAASLQAQSGVPGGNIEEGSLDLARLAQ